MTEIYVECRKFIFKLFLNACRVHSGVFFPSHFAISAFVVAVNCVCALVCQCANVCMCFFFFHQFALALDVFRLKKEKNEMAKQTPCLSTAQKTQRQCQRTLSRKFLLKFIQRESFHVTIKLDIHRFVDFSKFDSLLVPTFSGAHLSFAMCWSVCEHTKNACFKTFSNCFFLRYVCLVYLNATK